MEKLIELILFHELFCCLTVESAIVEDIAVVHICNATDSVDLAVLNDYMIHHDFNHLDNHATHQLACFLLCIYTEYNWMDRNGGFKVHNIKSWMHRAKLPHSYTEKLLRKCITPELTDPCTQARHFTECFWTNHQGALDTIHRHTFHSMIRKKGVE